MSSSQGNTSDTWYQFYYLIINLKKVSYCKISTEFIIFNLLLFILFTFFGHVLTFIGH